MLRDAGSLQRIARQARLQRSLHQFVQRYWPVVEPGVEFQDNWHVHAICDHLEAVAHGKIRQLVINVPPRHMKSLLVSVFWPCWVWTWQPTLRWLFASYAQSLSFRDSGKCALILQSDQWKEDWPDWCGLSRCAAGKIENNKLGYRLATSVGGATTGEGGDIVVVDDGLNALEAFSEAEREKANTWLDQAMSTRINDPRTGRRVMVCQRLHEDDPAGHVMKEGTWDALIIRARYEEKDTPVTSLGWKDPRAGKEGELLWKERFDERALKDLEVKLGTYGTAGQLQQRPAPLDGGLLPRKWWKFWKVLPELAGVMISVDCAFKDGAKNDYVVMQAWGWRGANRYLLAQVREKMDMPTTLRTLRNFHATVTAQFKRAVQVVLVEDAANGPAVISMLRAKVAALKGQQAIGSKEARAAAISPTVEAGNVYLPEDSAWVEGFVSECASFPNGAHDDQVDALTQAVNWINLTQVTIDGEIPDASKPNLWKMDDEDDEAD